MCVYKYICEQRPAITGWLLCFMVVDRSTWRAKGSRREDRQPQYYTFIRLSMVVSPMKVDNYWIEKLTLRVGRILLESRDYRMWYQPFLTKVADVLAFKSASSGKNFNKFFILPTMSDFLFFFSILNKLTILLLNRVDNVKMSIRYVWIQKKKKFARDRTTLSDTG